MCTYFRGRHIGQFDPAESIPARRIEFAALSRHLQSVAPNRTTSYNAVLQKRKKLGVFNQISEWGMSMLATVSIARCLAEIT